MISSRVVTNAAGTLRIEAHLRFAADDGCFTFGDMGPGLDRRAIQAVNVSSTISENLWHRGRPRRRFAGMISASKTVPEQLMQAKLQHPDLIETLFTMAGGDAELLERAVTSSAQRVDAAHLLKLVEFIIANRQKGRRHSMH